MMTKALNTPQEFVEIYQAIADGKDVEFWETLSKQWLISHSAKCVLNGKDILAAHFKYRVKPEPVTIWINVYSYFCSTRYESIEAANAGAGGQRTHCIPVVLDDKYKVSDV